VDVLLAHQALADPNRLAVAHALLTRDLSPGEIGEQSGLSTSLVAHHVKTLVEAGIAVRRGGEHDGRKSYLSLRRDDPEAVALVAIGAPGVPRPRRVAFVCTQNSARSKLAAALWRRVSDVPVVDAGTTPSLAPHPMTVQTAHRRGLEIDADMHQMKDTLVAGDLVIAVCDHVHETLPTDVERWHWSIPDPVPAAAAASFDDTCDAIQTRVHDLNEALTATCT
jgi:protein-tyrosine-phosphatase